MAKRKYYGVASAAGAFGTVEPGGLIELEEEAAEDLLRAGYVVRHSKGMTRERAEEAAVEARAARVPEAEVRAAQIAEPEAASGGEDGATGSVDPASEDGGEGGDGDGAGGAAETAGAKAEG